MPRPVSLTVTSTCELTRDRRSCTLPPRGGELDRVGQQVPDDLLEAFAITGYRRRQRIDDGLEPDAFGVRGGQHGGARVVQDRGKVHRRDVQAEPAGDDARDVEDVLDDLLERGRVALDDLQGGVGAFGSHGAAAQHPRIAEHRVERRAELVRQAWPGIRPSAGWPRERGRRRGHSPPPARRARPAPAPAAGHSRCTRVRTRR